MDATTELATLLDREGRLSARVSEIGAEERTAARTAQEASDTLVALERAAAGGTKVSAAKRAEAEDRLLAARTAAAAPWSERRRAAELAVTDARQTVAQFIGQNLDPLLADLADRGERAAQAVNAAAEALIGAYEARQAVERETFDLLGRVRRPRPGDVARTRCEQLVAEARKLTERGGEDPPTVLVRPGEPRHDEVAVEAEAVPA
jgi:hypothetical protein